MGPDSRPKGAEEERAAALLRVFEVFADLAHRPTPTSNRSARAVAKKTHSSEFLLAL
jgi:hypothetical protein